MDKGLTPDKIMQLGTAFWGSKALLSAVELGVFTELAGGALDLERLRERLGLHPRSARDFFDALVALGLLERDEQGYRNAPDTDRFLDRNKPTYIGGILEMANARLYPFWANLTEGLQTGMLQNEAKGSGRPFFESLYDDPERLKQFLRAMTAISADAAVAMAERFPWEEYQTVVDVGCAEGGVPVELAQRHGHLGGGGFDLPLIRPHFEAYVARHGLGERLGFHGGDFFTDDLPSADVLVMGHILHDWNLEQKKHLLSRAHKSLPKGGSLVVYEALIDDERRENAFGLLMSLNMLIETEGGFDFTGADCQGWMREVGFRETRVEPLVGPNSMVLAIK